MKITIYTFLFCLCDVWWSANLFCDTHVSSAQPSSCLRKRIANITAMKTAETIPMTKNGRPIHWPPSDKPRAKSPANTGEPNMAPIISITLIRLYARAIWSGGSREERKLRVKRVVPWPSAAIASDTAARGMLGAAPTSAHPTAHRMYDTRAR